MWWIGAAVHSLGRTLQQAAGGAYAIAGVIEIASSNFDIDIACILVRRQIDRLIDRRHQ